MSSYCYNVWYTYLLNFFLNLVIFQLFTISFDTRLFWFCWRLYTLYQLFWNKWSDNLVIISFFTTLNTILFPFSFMYPTIESISEETCNIWLLIFGRICRNYLFLTLRQNIEKKFLMESFLKLIISCILFLRIISICWYSFIKLEW